MCFAPQRRALFRHLNFQKWSEREVFLACKCASCRNGVHFFNNFQQWSNPPGVFKHLFLKCASPHNGVHFFGTATSKSGPELVCLVRFDLEMCFAPQRRALFRHLNSKSGPSMVCFVHFDLEMCFAPQRRALFHLSSGQMARHPPL